jgi:hypothetical protein
MTMVNQDEEHLRLLAIFYYVWAGMAAIGCCVGGIYAIMGGIFMGAAAANQGPNDPPAWFGGIFLIVGIGTALLALAYAGLNIVVGRSLTQRKNYVFCIVMAAINCLSIPFGTALGVFTIIVLQRPSVKQLFGPPTPASS